MIRALYAIMRPSGLRQIGGVAALFAAGRFPRWISAELHYYREKGAALVQAMRRHGYSLRGVPDVAVSDEIAIFAERKTS